MGVLWFCSLLNDMGMFLVVYLTKWVSLHILYMQQLSGWLGASLFARGMSPSLTHTAVSEFLYSGAPRSRIDRAAFSEDGEKAES